jgi:hypothetical protein
MSLHLGNEIFDVYKQPLQGDFNHMFIRQGTGLQGQAVFRTKLSFRPHSTESFTHQKLTRNMADRTNKASGIKVRLIRMCLLHLLQRYFIHRLYRRLVAILRLIGASE